MSEIRKDATIPELLERAAGLLDEAAGLDIPSELSKGLSDIAESIRSVELPEP